MDTIEYKEELKKLYDAAVANKEFVIALDLLQLRKQLDE